jgi:hypothetical protein
VFSRSMTLGLFEGRGWVGGDFVGFVSFCECRFKKASARHETVFTSWLITVKTCQCEP